MKRILIIIFIVFLFLSLSGGIFIYFYNNNCDKQLSGSTYTISKAELDSLQDGDIILRHGYGFVSDMIVEKLGEQYDISHCAIISKNDSSFDVIHSVSSTLSDIDGVQSQDIKQFIHESQANSVIIVRYKPKNGKDNSRISFKAREYLKKQIPFDNSFNINDSTEFYCTELLWKVFYNEYKDDILLGKDREKKDHLKFDIFLDTSRFKVIINHQLRKK